MNENSMPYSKPTQTRSRSSERNFLAAMDEMLRVHGYKNTTIDDVANRAGLTRAAFLKRFGSKEEALFVLFRKYCDQVTGMMRSLQSQLDEYPDIHFTLREMSQQFEAVLQTHMSSNRAMHEQFQGRLEVHELTKGIFKQSVALMKATQAQFLPENSYSDDGAWYAAQLLVTVDYNYLLRAMPAFPEDHQTRHNLIAELLEVTLKK